MFVLYADDDPDDLETLYDVLKVIDPEVTCVHARHGIEVLDVLGSAEMLPDFIFLDINMPLMDGRACLKELKKDARLAIIPVIIYTTADNPMDRALCLELGATAYFLKPTSFNKAVENLSEFFRTFKGSAR